jgi:hypothetical protein
MKCFLRFLIAIIWTKLKENTHIFLQHVFKVGYPKHMRGCFENCYFHIHLKLIGMNIVDGWMDGWMDPPS